MQLLWEDRLDESRLPRDTTSMWTAVDDVYLWKSPSLLGTFFMKLVWNLQVDAFVFDNIMFGLGSHRLYDPPGDRPYHLHWL